VLFKYGNGVETASNYGQQLLDVDVQELNQHQRKHKSHLQRKHKKIQKKKNLNLKKEMRNLNLNKEMRKMKVKPIENSYVIYDYIN